MSVIDIDISIDQGATSDLEFVWVDSNGVAADFVGAKAFLHVRHSPMSPLKLIELSTENGRIAFQGGSMWVRFEPSDTELALWRRAYYDLLLVYPDGARQRFSQGRVLLSRAVTKGVKTP